MKSSFILKFFPAAFLVLAGLLPAHNLFAQVSRQWVKFFDDPPNSQNIPIGIVADDWGNVYVTGYGTLSNSGNDDSSDYVTVKYNASGNMEWVARFDCSRHRDVPSAITIDKAGYIYITGESVRGDLNTDFATVKYNSDGIQQWVAYFNEPYNGYGRPIDLKVDDNGNVYVVGDAQTANGFSSIVLVKYNRNGIQQWQQFYDGPSNNFQIPMSMALNPVNSDVYITGFTSNENAQHDYITLRYNSAGVLQWARFYNGNNVANTLDEAKKIAVDAQGNAYVGGNSVSSQNVYGSVIIKYNVAGELLWAQRFNGPANVYGQQNDLAIDKSGNVYITGYVGYYVNGGARGACATVKYNTDGVQQWVQLNTAPLWNQAQTLALDEEGNVYITGRSYSGDIWTNEELITIKYNNQGEKKWVEEYDPAPDWDEPSGIAVNRLGDVFVAGRSTKGHVGYTTIYDYVTIKYAQVRPLVVKAMPDTGVYYGYGSNCVQLMVEVSGGTTPYSFSWSTGAKNNSTIVCPTATSIYTVTVKDVNGLTATGQVTVKVIDLRCEPKDKKIVVCHNGKELCLAASAVAAHLQHGDVLGNCIQGTITVKRENETNKTKPVFAIYPNPVRNTSTIYYSVLEEAYVRITVMDATGKEIKTIVKGRKLPGFYTEVINANDLATGIYLCRMTTSSSGLQSSYVLRIVAGK